MNVVLEENKIQNPYNDAEIIKYAAAFNKLCVENEICGFWWDCNEFVNRKELIQNVPGWAEAITGCYTDEKYTKGTDPDAVYTEESASNAVLNMKCGWNLGNTLDTHSQDYVFNENSKLWEYNDPEGGWMVKYKVSLEEWETKWNEPKTTKQMLEYVKSLGFNSVRVPVTWGEHLDDNNNIDPLWMNRVEEVVKYVLDSGMYCIINIHHDGGSKGWIKACDSSWNQFNGRFESIWTQIADRFNKYDEHLLFENMNEVLNQHASWDRPSEADMEYIHKWNQLFVDSVRKTGGNNKTRNLVIMGYAGSATNASLKNLQMPVDATQNHLILEVHDYNPTGFTWSDATWTVMTALYSENVERVLCSDFAVLAKYKQSLGVPVIVGEYAAFRKKYADFDKKKIPEKE